MKLPLFVGTGAVTGPTNGLLNGLVSYWKADTNGSFPDVHGSNDGTINGATFIASAKINGGYSYDGVNDYVDTGISIGTTFSTGGWFRFDSLSGTALQRCISERSTGELRGWYFRQVSSSNHNVRFDFYTTGPTLRQATTTFAITTGVWYHIGLSIDDTAKEGKIFMNGVERGSVSFTGSLIVGTRSLEFGRQGNAEFGGDGDEHPVYNRVLTSDDWLALYNSGDGLSYDDFTS